LAIGIGLAFAFTGAPFDRLPFCHSPGCRRELLRLPGGRADGIPCCRCRPEGSCPDLLDVAGIARRAVRSRSSAGSRAGHRATGARACPPGARRSVAGAHRLGVGRCQVSSHPLLAGPRSRPRPGEQAMQPPP
jgi:hypothetical protein